MLPAVKFAITNEEARMNLRGAKLEVDPEGAEVRLITTDGHRISLASGKLEGLLPNKFEVLIPIEGIDELTKLLGDKSESTVGIAVNANSLLFRTSNRILATRQVTGTFPSYQKPFAMLGTYEHFANFKADELALAVRMALLCAEDSDKEKRKTAGISIVFDSERIQIQGKSRDLGEANEVLGSDYNGPPITVFCNGNFLLDFLDPVGSGTIRFEIKDALTQMYLNGEHDDISYYYCLMPMRNIL